MTTDFLTRRLSAVALLTALAVGAAGLLPPAAPARSHKAQPKLSPRAKAKLRRQLRREIDRNPTVVFGRGFMKKADASGFQLPLTVRLNNPDEANGGYVQSDDQLQITWDDSTDVWPLGGVMPAAQAPFLQGTFTMQASFGGDATGYGELGALETVDGIAINMSSDPFEISDFNPACASGPQVAVDPNARTSITSAGPRYGVMNMFSNEFRGTLSLRMSFASQVQNGCTNVFATSMPIDNSTAPPMPVRFQGKFYVSPALTSDGRLRFGKIVIDSSAIPQPTTFAYVRACTSTTTADCSPTEFPARLSFKTLTADVLLGDIRSSSSS